MTGHNYAKTWSETKFLFRDGALFPSKDPHEVHPSSRIAARVIGRFYEKAIPVHVKGRLLDLGCGKAPLQGIYRQFATSVIRADWPVSIHRNPHTDVYCDVGRPLPFCDASFDTVLLSDVLEHLPDPALLWSELARILAPDGKVIGNIPFLYWIHEAPHDYQRLTPYGLELGMKAASLEPLALQRLGSPLETWMDLTAKLLISLPVLGILAGKALARASSCLEPFLEKRGAGSPIPLSIGFVVRSTRPH